LPEVGDLCSYVDRFSTPGAGKGLSKSCPPPLCGPCGYCLRQTPSVPPIGYRVNWLPFSAEVTAARLFPAPRGLPPLVATSWACAIFPTSVFSHTQNPPSDIIRHNAGNRWIATRSTLVACRHEPLSGSARRSPWLPPTAPVPPPRFACFVAGSIEAIRHASISRRGSLGSPMRRLRLAWLRQRHPARRIGSLFVPWRSPCLPPSAEKTRAVMIRSR
jgi:hypothetical protein